MKNKRKALQILVKKLEGMPWAIFSGTAVEIYTNGTRIGNDIDVVVPPDKIDDVAKRFKKKPILKTRGKDKVQIINDYFIETEIDGIPLEFVGATEKIIVDGYEYCTDKKAMAKLFPRVKKKEYLGVKVNVVPAEELLVQKMIFDRSGQWQDNQDIQMLLEVERPDKKDLLRSLKRWGVSEEKKGQFLNALVF